jgi:hypothetical protein
MDGPSFVSVGIDVEYNYIITVESVELSNLDGRFVCNVTAPFIVTRNPIPSQGVCFPNATNPNNIDCDLGSLPFPSNMTIVILFRVAQDAGGLLVNTTAYLFTYSGIVAASFQTRLVYSSDLAVIVPYSSIVFVGNNSFSVRVSNNGPSYFSPAQLVVEFSAKVVGNTVTSVLGNASAVICDFQGQSLLCDLSELQSGDTILITFSALVLGPPTLVNVLLFTANVTALNVFSEFAVIIQKATSTTTSRVYGQLDSFTSDVPNIEGVFGNSLWYLQSVFVASSGLHVADANNNRVLFYPGTSITATRVYGQFGNFTSVVSNNGGVSANSLLYPQSVFSDASGVYIADSSNSRVLFYPGTSTTATRVYGQFGDFTSSISNNGGVSINSLSYPQSVFAISSGFYVADANNNRVLFYPGISTTASRVYGQFDNFTSSDCNSGGVSANSLCYPQSVFVDASGVYIVDSWNSRVLFYPGTLTTATRVYGQYRLFTISFSNFFGVSANSLSYPRSVFSNASGVYIADSSNNRVLFFNSNILD